MIDTHTVDHAVRSCKVNVLKNAVCRLLLLAQTCVRFDAFLCDRNDLTRQYIPYKLGTNRIQCTGFTRQYIGISPFADAQRAEPLRISCSHQFSRRHDHKRIGSFDFLHGTGNCLFCRLASDTFSRNMICDHLGVNGRLKNRSAICQLFPQLRGIDQVSIVCKCKRAFDIIQYQRLCILSCAGSCRRITHMTDTDVSMKILQFFCIKHFVYKSHSLAGIHFSFWSFRITDGDTTALLSSVL